MSFFQIVGPNAFFQIVGQNVILLKTFRTEVNVELLVKISLMIFLFVKRSIKKDIFQTVVNIDLSVKISSNIFLSVKCHIFDQNVISVENIQNCITY